MALINQPFPVTGSKIAEPDGSISLAYRYLLQALWNRTGAAPGVNITEVEATANQALADAIAAQAAANAAQSSANAAQATANTAILDAAAALAAANAAQTTANSASSDATTALANAAAAQSTANTAVTNAATAQTTANTAITNAATAQSGANASLKIASNLSDLANVATARTNLGLGPIATSATATGWTAPTGTIARTAIDGSWTQTISAIPTQAEVQSIVAQLVSVGQGLAALITDETTVKTIGP